MIYARQQRRMRFRFVPEDRLNPDRSGATLTRTCRSCRTRHKYQQVSLTRRPVTCRAPANYYKLIPSPDTICNDGNMARVRARRGVETFAAFVELVFGSKRLYTRYDRATVL